MSDNTKCSLVGYHGTDLTHKGSILNRGFLPSKGSNHWLGTGVYFFIDGISDNSVDDAANWAKAQAWNKEFKRYNYANFIVLSAIIEFTPNIIWDLTVEEGLKQFNYARAEIIKKLSTAVMQIANEKPGDSDIIDVVSQKMGFELIKGNFYIKFTRERILRIESRIPNVTITAVRNPELIRINSISETRKGKVSDHEF